MSTSDEWTGPAADAARARRDARREAVLTEQRIAREVAEQLSPVALAEALRRAAVGEGSSAEQTAVMREAARRIEDGGHG